jgi:hypothetical protein
VLQLFVVVVESILEQLVVRKREYLAKVKLHIVLLLDLKQQRLSL